MDEQPIKKERGKLTTNKAMKYLIVSTGQRLCEPSIMQWCKRHFLLSTIF
jgi:hypothetical protein